ncbi:hypothetical protein AM493_11085 [Flavobacterium akiainvivens]|uniref:Uncharacterized protein n=1 Tax=Flavobacterium akiainvivens TaxID=1202724 RepID=A0A0M8MBB0_9FLAO|nr:hypothetical protein [Flavobacterium akiainvivens]KOS06515.1 hypothetical protein AM493_11085 [Flavobacterium akiainvivens]SFQ11624.1 hypothetical protein SAMN05444144_101143 [Flavobacterium akiainvivens]
MDENLKLFGNKKKNDWIALRNYIIIDSNIKKNWEDVVELLNLRLETRYFKPIEAIQNIKSYQGEGFAAITLLCSLIEFLQSSYEGKYYLYGVQETEFIYSRSKNIFKRFLTSHYPFLELFDEAKAHEFYESIRCGLLHEAATKDNWKINLRSNNEFIDFESKTLYTNNFIKAIREYISSYEQQIINDENGLRFKLARKMDSLSGTTIDTDAPWW